MIVIKSYGFAQIEFPARAYPFNFKYLAYAAQDLIVNDTIVPTYQASKYYYINSYTGKKVLNQGFEEAYPFYNGFGLVRINGKYGIIKRDSEIVVKPTFRGFEFSGDRPSISFRGGYGLNFFNLVEGTLSDRDYMDGDPVEPIPPVIKKGRQFYLRDTTRKDIPLIYDDFATIKNFWKYNGFYGLRKNQIWYYFKKDKLLFKSKFNPLSFADNVFIYKTQGKYNILNNKGITVLPKNYSWISPTGRVAVNMKGDVVILNKANKEFMYSPGNRTL
ncbi:MAG: WG repeat-containing protein [Bacteroidota bacterium]